MPSKARWSLVIAFLVAGSFATGFAAGESDPDDRSIWIGLASTLVTAGIVDCLGLMERRRQAGPIERAAARRVGETYRHLAQIATAVFPDLDDAPGLTYVEKLQAYPKGHHVAFTDQHPKVWPQQTRYTYLRTQIIGLENVRDELVTFVGTGSLDGYVESLDRILTDSGFLLVLRGIQPNGQGSALSLDGHFRDLAISLFGDFAPIFEMARRACGESWHFGTLEVG